MKKNKLLAVLLAVTLVFAMLTHSVFAAKKSTQGTLNPDLSYYAFVAISDDFASAISQLSCSSNARIQSATDCRALTDSNNMVMDSDFGPEGTYQANNTVNCIGEEGDVFVAAFSDHHFYRNGSLVDTVSVNVYLGEDR